MSEKKKAFIEGIEQAKTSILEEYDKVIDLVSIIKEQTRFSDPFSLDSASMKKIKNGERKLKKLSEIYAHLLEIKKQENKIFVTHELQDRLKAMQNNHRKV